MADDQVDRVFRNLVIDVRRDEYKIALTRGYADDLFKSADRAPAYRQNVADLLIELRSLTNVASIPHTVVSQFDEYQKGFHRQRSAKSEAEKAIDLVAKRLIKDLESTPNVSFSVEQYEAIQGMCLAIQQSLGSVPDMISPQFAQDLWADYIELQAFQSIVWGAQRTALVSIYNAYESFLTNCTRTYHQDPAYRHPNGRIGPSLEETFGQDARHHCWDANDLNVARCVRNAIAHNGGKETADLKKLTPSHQIAVVGDDRVLQVFPGDVVRLVRAVEIASKYLIDSQAAEPSADERDP